MAVSNWLKLVVGRFRKVVIAASAIAVIIWFVFFDSYSLIMRIQLHSEKARLQNQNERLREEISLLDEKLSRPLTDKEVERIAREEYHMSRKGETVYPVVEQ